MSMIYKTQIEMIITFMRITCDLKKTNYYRMKLLLLGLLILFAANSYSQKSTGALHCLGNGKYCVYEKGVEITSLFGPTYSSPSYVRLVLSEKALSVVSTRVPGTAIWKHTLYRKNEKIAEITDFTDSELPVFARKITAFKPFSLNLYILKDSRIDLLPNTADYAGTSAALMIHKERGLPIYGDYAHPYEQFQQLIVRGAQLEKYSQSDSCRIKIAAGESEIYFVGGPFYKDVVENTQKVLSVNYNDLYNRTFKDWEYFSGKRTDFASRFTEKNPDRQKILDQIDHIAVLLRTQQSAEGAVLAGDFYHLAYVRDQYGVSRGFLALGYYEEAKRILDFYWQIWKKSGVLHNAQAIGVPGIFHIHENDEVELTGYLIIQAFDYLKKTNDTKFIETIFPMLKWAWDAQKNNLVNFMLPFNGDETYVAGGIMPRTALNDGSAEATLLFVQSGRLLLPFMKQHKLLSYDRIQADEKLTSVVANHYAENFIKQGRILANNPLRMSISQMPDFRHGVCAGGHGVVYTKKDSNGNYMCPRCLIEKKESIPFERNTFYIPSIALTPLYIGSDLIPGNILSQNIDTIKSGYAKSGQISSRPGVNTVIGYEFGFFLYALAQNHDPFAERIFNDAMAVVDESGAWVEYYSEGKPMGCRYRPWESAINIEAIIEYALSREKQSFGEQ